MRTTNQGVYPITAEVEEELDGVAVDMGLEKGLDSVPAVRKMLDVLVEYEHGTADAVDVFGGHDTGDGDFDEANKKALMYYASVVSDLGLVFLNES